MIHTMYVHHDVMRCAGTHPVPQAENLPFLWKHSFKLVCARRYFRELSEELKQSGSQTVSGDSAFFLYDTMGFPLDLTQADFIRVCVCVCVCVCV